MVLADSTKNQNVYGNKREFHEGIKLTDGARKRIQAGIQQLFLNEIANIDEKGT
jgi:hypothetical protein